MSRHVGQIRHIPRPAPPPPALAAPPPPPPPVPLGTLVERFVQPIARFLDRTLGTHLAGCSACSRRRQYLNHLVPDIRSLSAWASAWRRLRPSRSVPSVHPPASRPRD